jgi:hypothetical protein
MTQPYGQQPGDQGQPGGQYPGSGGFQQPGGQYPGSGGFQQPGGQYPGSGGFPQAPQPPSYQQGYAGMPQAPQEYGGGAVTRPGGTTAAAVLAFVQAGITLITTAILMIALAAIQDLANGAEETAGGIALGGALAEFWIVSIVQLIGIGLLIAGGVKLLGGRAGNLFVIAVGLQIVLCVYWLIRIVTNSGSPMVPLILVVMPIISLVLALNAANKEYVRYKSGRPA